MLGNQNYFENAWNNEQVEQQGRDGWDNPLTRLQLKQSSNDFHTVNDGFVQKSTTSFSDVIPLGISSTNTSGLYQCDSLPRIRPSSHMDFHESLGSTADLGNIGQHDGHDANLKDQNPAFRASLVTKRPLQNKSSKKLGEYSRRKSHKKRLRLNCNTGTPHGNQQPDTTSHARSHVSTPPSSEGLSLVASGACNHWCSSYPGKLAGHNEIYGIHLAYHAPMDLLTQWFQLHGRINEEADVSPKRIGSGCDVTLKYRHHQRRCKTKDTGGQILRDDDEPYACTSRCGAKFKKKDCWRRHEELNFPQMVWLCGAKDCGAVSFRKDHFRNHVRKCHDHPKISKIELMNSRHDIDSQFDKHCIFRKCNELFSNWKDRIDHIAKELEGPWHIVDWRDMDKETGDRESRHRTDTDSDSDSDDSDASDGGSDSSDSDHDNDQGAGPEPDSSNGSGSSSSSGTGSSQGFGQFGQSGAYFSGSGYEDHGMNSFSPNWMTGHSQWQKSSAMGNDKAAISAELSSTTEPPLRIRDAINQIGCNKEDNSQGIPGRKGI